MLKEKHTQKVPNNKGFTQSFCRTNSPQINLHVRLSDTMGTYFKNENISQFQPGSQIKFDFAFNIPFKAINNNEVKKIALFVSNTHI